MTGRPHLAHLLSLLRIQAPRAEAKWRWQGNTKPAEPKDPPKYGGTKCDPEEPMDERLQLKIDQPLYRYIC